MNNMNQVSSLSIQGHIPDKISSDFDPAILVSFFILNINESPSLKRFLSDATIKHIEYKDHLYNFEIEVKIKSKRYFSGEINI